MSSTPEAVDLARGDTRQTLRHRGVLRKREHPHTIHAGRPTWRWLTPAAVYLAVRLFGLLVLALMCAANDKSFGQTLSTWDGQWYLQIATHGYSGVDPSLVDGYGHRTPETPLAFFPGYPALIRLFAVIPWLGIHTAAIVASLAAGVAAAYGLARLGRGFGGDRAGLLLVTLFAALPMSIVLSMAYSEALFCALAVWTLVGVVERNWPLAGLCCAAAGLVRPTAAALIGVVLAAALIAVVRREDGWRPWTAILVAPTGLLSYLGWVAARTGRLDGYFELQERGWSSAFDGGRATLSFVVQTLSGDSSAFETVTVWIVLAAVVLLIVSPRSGMPWPLVVFAILVLAQDLGSDGLMYSKVRLMLPAFPLLVPVALRLANSRTRTVVCAMGFFVLFGAWFGAYALTVWKYAI